MTMVVKRQWWWPSRIRPSEWRTKIVSPTRLLRSEERMPPMGILPTGSTQPPSKRPDSKDCTVTFWCEWIFRRSKQWCAVEYYCIQYRRICESNPRKKDLPKKSRRKWVKSWERKFISCILPKIQHTVFYSSNHASVTARKEPYS